MLSLKNQIEERIFSRLQGRVPEKALQYCFLLWRNDPFRLLISKERKSKTGDFRAKRSEKFAVITVNENLNHYAFLITYIHEVAHHLTFKKFGWKIPPHGREWKAHFIELISPLLNEEVFPLDILLPLEKHMRNPKASSHSDYQLSKALQAYDSVQNDQGEILEQLSNGSLFKFQNKAYKKVESRRSRVRCEEVKSRRFYLIHKLARVDPIN